MYCLRGLLFGLLTLLSLSLSAQCFSGVLTVSGSGCGCLAGCNLSPFGGVNCGAGVTGNCSGGQLNMSVLIPLDPTCEVTVEARFSNRPGCSSSGADSGDRMRVRDAAGTAPWQTGAANASLFDTHTQLGGSIVVEGTSNRADEIITYDVIYVNGNCPFCLLLPVTFTDFSAHLSETILQLDWRTGAEVNNEGFEVQMSFDNEHFSSLDFVPGAGTSAIPIRYSAQVPLPSFRSFYVRLMQRDFNGATMYSPTIFVEQKATQEFQVFSQGNQLVVQNLSENDRLVDLQVYTIDGRMIFNKSVHVSAGGQTFTGELTGLSVVLLFEGGEIVHNERVFFE